MQAKQEFF